MLRIISAVFVVTILAIDRYNCKATTSKSQLFLSKLLVQLEFRFCKLIFIDYQGHEQELETTTYITSSSNFSYYSLLFSQNSPIENNGTSSFPVQFPSSIRDHFKRSGQCFVVIIIVKDQQPEYMTKIFNMITPIYIPKTRKDEDYYIFMTKPDDSKAILMMNELPARIKYKIAISETEDKELLIRSVCFFCNDGSPTFVEFPESRKVNYFPDFVTNLNGKTLRISIPLWDARIELDYENQGLNNAKRGLWKNLFEEFLGVKFNFTYTMFLAMGSGESVRPGGTGVQLVDASWTGVVGDLYYGNAELGILTSRTSKRIYVMDVSDTFFDVTYLTFVTSKGTRIYSALALLWSFDELMWLLIILSTLLSFGIFKLLLKSIDLLGINNNNTSTMSFARRGIQSKDNWGLTHQVQLIVTSFLDQDCVMPTFGPLRCYVAFWLFFTVVITSAYKSKLVALMAFPVMQEVPKTFKDLAYSDYKVGFLKHGDSAYNTIAVSTDPVYKKLVAEMEIMKGVGLNCLEMVVKIKSACIAYEFSVTYVKERNLSELDTRKLIFSSDHTYNIWTGLSYEGRSIYKKNLDKWLRLTRPMHLADIWERQDYQNNVRIPKLKWWLMTNQTDKAKKIDETDSNNLTLKQITGSFYVLIGGLFIGICTLIIELIVVHLDCFYKNTISYKNERNYIKIQINFALKPPKLKRLERHQRNNPKMYISKS